MSSENAVLSEVESSALSIPDVPLSLALSPSGRPYLDRETDSQEMVPVPLADHVHTLFSSDASTAVSSSEIGILRLGATHFNSPLPPSVFFWQSFGQLFIHEARQASAVTENLIEASFQVPPPLLELASLKDHAPFMRGSEYLTLEVLEIFWERLNTALHTELVPFAGNLQDFLSLKSVKF